MIAATPPERAEGRLVMRLVDWIYAGHVLDAGGYTVGTYQTAVQTGRQFAVMGPFGWRAVTTSATDAVDLWLDLVGTKRALDALRRSESVVMWG